MSSIAHEFTTGWSAQNRYPYCECSNAYFSLNVTETDALQPTGHAFILRRFDTGAISLTTMFRAAFPNASDVQEKEEITWVKQNNDLAGNNGSSRDTNITRLAGIWVPPDLAAQLAREYDLGPVIQVVVEARPDPDVNYRRAGGKSTHNTPDSKSGIPTRLPPTTNSPTSAPSPKRRKEASPAPSEIRRSLRSTKSPGPRSSATKPSRKPPSRRTPDTDMKANHSLPSITDEFTQQDGGIEDVVQTELHDEDVAEQKAMIDQMKADRMGQSLNSQPKSKREREEETPAFNFEKPAAQVTERAIATNRRVSRVQLGPQAKSAAWGVAAFAFAASAM